MKRTIRASATVYASLAMAAAALCAQGDRGASRIPANDDWCVNRKECEPAPRIPRRKGPDYSGYTVEQRQSAIFSAIMDGKADHVQAILKAGIDVNAKNGFGRTALYEAAFHGSLKIAQLLLDAGADPRITNDIQETPIFAAVLGANVEVAKLLARRGLDMNAKSKTGVTPLFFAILRDDAKMTRALLELGAGPSIEVKPGFDHYDVALSRGKYSALKAMPQIMNIKTKVNRHLGDGKTFLGNAVESKDYKTAKFLLTLGADPNAKFKSERSMLNRAIFDNDKKAVDFLLKNGADPDQADGNGHDALHMSVMGCKADLARKFIKTSINLNYTANDGHTPLTDAILAMDTNTDCVRILLDGGADPNYRTRDDFSRTPLQVASQMNNWPFLIIELLLKAGARANGVLREQDLGHLLMQLNYPGSEEDPLHQFKRSKKTYEILVLMTRSKMTWKDASYLSESDRAELLEGFAEVVEETEPVSDHPDNDRVYDDPSHVRPFFRRHVPIHSLGP